MRYHALAADYDGTLAHHGKIDEATWDALRRLRDSGRKLVMVTGRELDELLGLLEHPELFHRIVAENGGVIYNPATKQERLLCEPPPARFAEELQRRGVERVSVGRVIVATWEPHEDVVFHVIRDLGLEMQVIFNKGAVMVLPSGVNKATGLKCALGELGLSSHNVVAVGDAENDHAMLELAECGVAVANALPALKERADFVTAAGHGAGVTELIGRLIVDDLAALGPTIERHLVLLGRTEDGTPVRVDPYASTIMVCGTSGSGKSTLTTGLLERLSSKHYQFAILDPEGDYASLEFAVVLGATKRPPLVEEVLDVLRVADENVVVNMLGVAIEHRPEFFVELLPALGDMRARTGRPHWLVVDEAHHLLPASWEPARELTLRPHGTLYVTVHPGSMSAAALATIDTVLAVGERPDETIREFCGEAKIEPPQLERIDKLPSGHTLYWHVGAPTAVVVQTEKPTTERTRHSRKYIEGNLGRHRSFYFRGREGKLKLKAHNLQLFVQLADGVDDDTWEFHLHNGEYSQWMRNEVKDPELADEVMQVELANGTRTPTESRAAVRAAVEKRYTLPADKPTGVLDPKDLDPADR